MVNHENKFNNIIVCAYYQKKILKSCHGILLIFTFQGRESVDLHPVPQYLMDAQCTLLTGCDATVITVTNA